MRAPRRNAPLIRFLTSALYILFACLYRMLLRLSFFLHFFFTCLLPYLSFPSRIDLLRFQAGCRKRLWLVNACFYCVVLGLVFFPYQAKRLAWGNVSEITYFVSSGTQNRNSANQSIIWHDFSSDFFCSLKFPPPNFRGILVLYEYAYNGHDCSIRLLLVLLSATILPWFFQFFQEATVILQIFYLDFLTALRTMTAPDGSLRGWKGTPVTVQ